jgi:hypothetical protein
LLRVLFIQGQLASITLCNTGRATSKKWRHCTSCECDSGTWNYELKTTCTSAWMLSANDCCQKIYKTPLGLPTWSLKVDVNKPSSAWTRQAMKLPPPWPIDDVRWCDWTHQREDKNRISEYPLSNPLYQPYQREHGDLTKTHLGLASPARAIRLSVTGDGQMYKVGLRASDGFREPTWQAQFLTRKGERITVTLPLDEEAWHGSIMGRRAALPRGEPIPWGSMQGVGFSLSVLDVMGASSDPASFHAGPFELQLHSMEVLSAV